MLHHLRGSSPQPLPLPYPTLTVPLQTTHSFVTAPAQKDIFCLNRHQNLTLDFLSPLLLTFLNPRSNQVKHFNSYQQFSKHRLLNMSLQALYGTSLDYFSSSTPQHALQWQGANSSPSLRGVPCLHLSDRMLSLHGSPRQTPSLLPNMLWLQFQLPVLSQGAHMSPIRLAP